MKSPQLRTAIQTLEAEIQPLLQKLTGLRRQLETAESREFIAANGITRAEIQLSSGPGVPWFGDVGTFGAWLKAQPSVKRWAEWNGRVFHSADLISGRMPRTPALFEHVA